MEPSYYADYHRWEREHWWFIARRRIIGRLLDDYAGKGVGSVLEVGCGTGGMAPLLAKYGRTTAIDASAAVVPYVRGAYRAFAAMEAEALGIRSGSFDLVMALDVIEHTDDARALREIHRVCRPGGLAVVTVPAFRFLWGRQDVISHHRRRYRKGEVGALIRAAGFRVIRLSYFNTLLFPAVAALRLAMRWLPATAPAEKRSDFGLFETGPLAKASLALFSLEARVLPFVSLPFGVSVVCVARKG